MKDLSFIGRLPESQQRAILEGPALHAPLNASSNLLDPPNKNELGYAIGLTSAIIATLLVLARLYARIAYHKTITFVDCMLHCELLSPLYSNRYKILLSRHW